MVTINLNSHDITERFYKVVSFTTFDFVAIKDTLFASFSNMLATHYVLSYFSVGQVEHRARLLGATFICSSMIF